VEIKAYGRGIQSGMEQAKSYLSHSPTCQYAIVTDGNEIIIFNRSLDKLDDIPQFNPSMLPSSIRKKRFLDLKHSREYTLLTDDEDRKKLIIETEGEGTSYGVDQLKKFFVYSFSGFQSSVLWQELGI